MVKTKITSYHFLVIVDNIMMVILRAFIIKYKHTSSNRNFTTVASKTKLSEEESAEHGEKKYAMYQHILSLGKFCMVVLSPRP